MKFKTAIAAAFAVALSCVQAFGQATILPPGETCFQAVTGLNGMVGTLGTITGGSLYTNGTYGGVSLTGGSGSNVTANITVSGNIVTGVAILNPGINYVVGDVLSASAASIGGTGSGFSVPVNSISINSAVAGGTIGFYIPNTLTPKQTWQDSGESVLNQNPVPLDSNGCAVIYGAGIYRTILKDSLGNTVWDKLTASTGAGGNGIFWAGLAGGTGNAITVTDTAFALQDGATIQFLAKLANTGPTTISVSGGSPIAIVNDTSTGPAALTGGEIGPFNAPMITYDATNSEFHLVNPAATSSTSSTSNLTPPQGYLNLVGQASGNVIQTGDVSGATTVYYSPYVGNTIPIWNGSLFRSVVFSELTATLTAAGSAANAIQDECVFSNNGVPTLVTAPAWTTPTAGSSSRGTGAGTAQITRLQGVWVNSVSIIGYNGLSSFTIAANQCTYVGSIWIDATAGQVTAHRTFGQNRKFGIWNAYNRVPITVLAGDTTASWTYNTATIRSSNNAPPTFAGTTYNVGSGTAANGITTLTGLAEEITTVNFQQLAEPNYTGGAPLQIGIGYNAITAYSSLPGTLVPNDSTNPYSISTSAVFPPSLGINVITTLEKGSGSAANVYLGTSADMLLQATWRG